ncbi:MAG TPA: S41 family peptidase [Armatimonadota bacterium]|nr:S41 family peptidase [Armatimonadota bacterium]
MYITRAAAGRNCIPERVAYMRVKQFALAGLIILAMGAGFISRSQIVDKRDPVAQAAQQNRRLPSQLSAYAPSSATDVGGRSDVDLRPLEVFYDALQHLRNEYVEPIQKNQERDLTYGSLKLMLDSLRDPLTRFYDPKQAKIVEDAQNGKFHGIGAMIFAKQVKEGEITEEKLVVVNALPGGPAQKAGVRPGDIITAIDGKSILSYDPFQRAEMVLKEIRNGKIDEENQRKFLLAENERIKNGIDFQKAMDMLSGSEGDTKEFTLTVTRAGVKDPLKIKVGTADVAVEPVTHTIIQPATGYIRINLITKSAEDKFNEAVAAFKKAGLKSIVIDLRDSPGGAVESAQAIASNLIPRKTLTLVQLPQGKQRTLRALTAETTPWTGNVVVLVNSGTCGVSVVLAAALRDGASAKLVGETTFGTNIEQTFMTLRDGSAVSITTGKYLTPKGVDYLNKGLAPDVAVKADKSKPGQDPQLTKAIEIAKAGKERG